MLAAPARALLSIGIAGFLFMSLFGIFHPGMSMSMDGTMSDCPFMSGMNMCPMSPLEHASFMHDLFANIPQPANFLLAFLLSLSAVAIIACVWFRNLYAPPDLVYQRTQGAASRSISIEPLLQELFSSGILNPKLFS